MTILDQINLAIQDQTGNNHPPQRVRITKTYQDNPGLCDIQTRTGNKLTKIPVHGTPEINTEALLIYEDGDQNKPIIIPNTDTYTRDNIDNLLEKKVSEPTSEGTNGQVLTTDGQGGRTWKTVQGGGTGVDIATSWGNPTSDSKVPSEKLAKDTLEGKANVSHTHTKSEITDFPTIPTKTSDLTNDGDGTNAFLTQHQSLVNYVQKSSISGLLKNDGSVDTTQYLSSLPSHNHDDRYYTESEMDTALNTKQATLVSGTNIKTINNNSLLGSGNISISGSGTVDTALDTTSTNPVQNQAIATAIDDLETDITSLSGSITNKIYPIGSIYMSVNNVNPNVLFGGTWEKIEDTFLLASGTTYSNGSTGGSATVTLTENQMPSHTHTQNAHTHTGTEGRGFVTHTEGQSVSEKRVSVPSSGSNYAPIISSSDNWYSVGSVGSTTATNQNKGGGQAHENMPPYLAVNVWKRTA